MNTEQNKSNMRNEGSISQSDSEIAVLASHKLPVIICKIGVYTKLTPRVRDVSKPFRLVVAEAVRRQPASHEHRQLP